MSLTAPSVREKTNLSQHSDTNDLVQSSHEFAEGESLEIADESPSFRMSPASGSPEIQMSPSSVEGVSAFSNSSTNSVLPASPSDIQLADEKKPEEEKLSMSPKTQVETVGKEEEETGIQPKLAVGKPGDKFEREADAVADRVVNQLTPGSGSPEIQGKEEEEEELVQQKVDNVLQADFKFPEVPEVKKEEPSETMLPPASEAMEQGKPAAEETTSGESAEQDLTEPAPIEEVEAPEITTKPEPNASREKSALLESDLQHSKGKGETIQGEVKNEMESGFGTDFSQVKVHTDPPAIRMNQELGSKAFTNQKDIYFNQGEFNPGSREGKKLLAHELTHTIQQGAVGNTVQTFTPPEHNVATDPAPTNPNDGDQVTSRTDSKIRNDSDFDEDAPTSRSEMDEEDREKAKPDRGEVRSEQREVESSGDAEVDIDRGEVAKERSEEQKEQITEQVTSEPPTAEGESEQQQGEGEDLSEADAAAQRSRENMAQANSVTIPNEPAPFRHPRIEAPVDKAGEPLPRKPEIDTQVRGLGQMGEMFREHGYEMKKYAANKEKYAWGLESNLETQREDLANAKEGTSKMEEHNIARKEISEQSKEALRDSKERQAFVAGKAPELAGEADKGKEESGDLVSESESKAERSRSEIPDDEDARADAEQQSGEMEDTAAGAQSMDEAITKTGERARQYADEAEVAAEKNTETEGGIAETDSTLEQTASRITEMQAKNEESAGKIEGVAAGPEQIRQHATQTAQSGDELIEATYVMEAELLGIQENYLSGMAAIESREEAEERIRKEQEEGGSQELSPEEQQLMELAGLPDEELQERTEDMDEPERRSLLQTLEQMIAATPDSGTDETEGRRLEVNTGLNEAIMGEQPADPRAPEIQEVDQERIQRLSGVLDIADQNMVFLSEEEQAMLAQRLVGESIADEIKNIDILQMGKGMIQAMIDPRMALTGAVDGFEKMASGFVNIFNAEAWARDPLGNLLQIAADISTGLAMIFSTILGIAGLIMALMVAITIASWGFALPFTGPVMGWMGTVMTYAGWGAIIAGSLSVYFNYLSYIKNLHDAATADSARELFGNTEQMRQNATDGFQGAMAIVEGVGAVKMGPALRSGSFIENMPRNPMQAARQFAGGVRDTASAIGHLPANIARGARRLFSGGKQGLIRFKDKLQGFFRSTSRTDVDIDVPSSTRRPHGDADVPSDTPDTGGSRTRTDAPETETPPRRTDTPESEVPDSPNRVKSSRDGDLGSVDGRKVEAEMDLGNGHKKKVLEDGECATCTYCRRTREKFGDELNNEANADLKQRLDDVEARLDADPENADLIREHHRIENDLYQRRLRSRDLSRTKRAKLEEIGNSDLTPAQKRELYEFFDKSTENPGRYRFKGDTPEEWLTEARAARFADDIDPDGINPNVKEVYRELERLGITDPEDLQKLKTHFRENLSARYPNKSDTNLRQTLDDLNDPGKNWDPETRRFSSGEDRMKDFWNDERKADLESSSPGTEKTPARGTPEYDELMARKGQVESDIADLETRYRDMNDQAKKVANGELDLDELDAETRQYHQDKEASFERRHPEADHRSRFEEKFDEEFAELRDQPDYLERREQAFREDRNRLREEHGEAYARAHVNQKKGEIFEQARESSGATRRTPNQKEKVVVDGQEMNVAPDMELPGEFIEMKSGPLSYSADVEDQILRYAALSRQTGRRITYELLQGADGRVIALFNKYGIDFIDYSKIN